MIDKLLDICIHTWHMTRGLQYHEITTCSFLGCLVTHPLLLVGLLLRLIALLWPPSRNQVGHKFSISWNEMTGRHTLRILSSTTFRPPAVFTYCTGNHHGNDDAILIVQGHQEP